jgi:hypothetical protein
MSHRTLVPTHRGPTAPGLDTDSLALAGLDQRNSALVEPPFSRWSSRREE